jgi:hypothetical protein
MVPARDAGEGAVASGALSRSSSFLLTQNSYKQVFMVTKIARLIQA